MVELGLVRLKINTDYSTSSPGDSSAVLLLWSTMSFPVESTGLAW